MLIKPQNFDISMTAQFSRLASSAVRIEMATNERFYCAIANEDSRDGAVGKLGPPRMECALATRKR